MSACVIFSSREGESGGGREGNIQCALLLRPSTEWEKKNSQAVVDDVLPTLSAISFRWIALIYEDGR
jgi:hypothetical protein